MHVTIKKLFRNRLLHILLLTGIIIPIFIPLRTYLFILPQFSDKLLVYSEEEALKTANHISNHVITLDHDQIVVNEPLSSHLHSIMSEFNLERIKLFSEKGLIIFSTKKEDIGKMNEHDYFHQKVAKGEIFSKIVTKNDQTLEGRVVNKDVAEIYVPIMRGDHFVGAFELYYDLTGRKNELDRLLRKEAGVSIVISLIMIGMVSIMVYQTRQAMLEQKNAEDQLKAINQNLEQIVAAKTDELETTQETAIESLAILAEYHDMDTGEHLTRIRLYTEMLATTLLSDSPYSSYLHNKGKEAYVKELVLASTLHDIGKTAISKEILCKPAKLTSEEFDEVKNHTVIAWDALDRGNKIFIERFGKDSYLALAGNIALYHHEKWDGTGYPSRLKGEAIPLSARIVALADVYDALRSQRPYKDPWPHEKTAQLIRSESGKHFDPIIVEAFFSNQEKFHQISQDSNQQKG